MLYRDEVGSLEFLFVRKAECEIERKQGKS